MIASSADRRADAKQRKIVAANQFAAENLGTAIQDDRAEPVAAHHPAEDRVAVANVLIHRIGQRVPPVVTSIVTAASGQHYDALRFVYRKQPQDELVDEREHGGVSADSKRQRKE